MGLSCGSCNLCCTLLAVPDVDKPARMMCWNTTIHGGCSRQAEKPDPQKAISNPDGTYSLGEGDEGKDLKLLACATFKCLWLASQSQTDPLKQKPRHLRPDMTHVVMGPFDREDDTLLYVQVDPRYPTAWNAPAILDDLRGIISRGGKVEIIIDETRFRLDEV